MKIAFLSIILITLAVLLLGIRVLFTKNGKFPSGHIHNNARLRNKGIGCAVQSNNKNLNNNS